MTTLKKILLFILPFLLLSTGIWFAYNYYYGGKDYYTQVHTPDDVKSGKFDNGVKYTEYQYTQAAYDKNGDKTTQKMSEIRDQPLRINAYLKLKVNAKKGVISWEEVSEKDIPKKALEHLTE